jgi:predicted DNA-binding helix-hairpin-helix protein
MLRLDVDPKLAWALAHAERFPVDLNRAPREMLLRVPGLGVKAVDRCCWRGACAGCAPTT